MFDFAVIIPAAGGSSRLGRPKQLVIWDDEPLVRRAARTALESGAKQVVIVVGAHAEEVSKALDGLNIEIVNNPNWQLGIGGSIRCGAQALVSNVSAAVVTLCDMPKVTPGILSELATAVERGDPPIAAAEYDCVLGSPCAFHRSEFPALLGLKGDTGARSILRSAPKIAMIEFPGGVCDVDTEKDLP